MLPHLQRKTVAQRIVQMQQVQLRKTQEDCCIDSVFYTSWTSAGSVTLASAARWGSQRGPPDCAWRATSRRPAYGRQKPWEETQKGRRPCSASTPSSTLREMTCRTPSLQILSCWMTSKCLKWFCLFLHSGVECIAVLYICTPQYQSGNAARDCSVRSWCQCGCQPVKWKGDKPTMDAPA